MENVVKCPKGHVYDRSLTDDCPLCTMAVIADEAEEFELLACPNGHFYNKYLNDGCPVCASQMVSEMELPEVTQGISGFHGFGDFGGSGAIGFCGWADYMAEGWHPGKLSPMQGVAFRINRESFPRGPVRLYYVDDDNFPGEWEDKDNLIRIIRQYSSGISNVHTERHVCTGWDSERKERTVLIFDLDPDAVHHTVSLSGEHVPAKALGDYVFVLPRCGEFYCALGQIRDGQMIPLHKDDFCMK